MRYANKLMSAVAVGSIVSVGFAAQAHAQAPAEGPPSTTRERILNAADEPHNWLMYTGTLNAWHYSKLSEINRENVGNLRPLFMASIGGATTRTVEPGNGNEMASPIVEEGFLYITDSHNKVMAFDVRSGNRALPLWRHDPETGGSRNTRGVSIYGDTVIQATWDARLVALDKQSGEVVWDVSGREPEGGPNAAEFIATRSFTSVPMIIPTAGGQDLVTAGPNGAGVGWVGAWNAQNGDFVWRTYTIPQPGEPNFGTWPGETWKWGAAMPWGGAYSLDPETNTLFVGTGEPSPAYDPEFRAGDNLYSSSTLALDADTGAMKWFFQETPNDQWDFDSTSTRLIFDLKQPDGSTRRAVHNWARNGFFYSLDIETGEFIRAVPTVDNINWTAGIDPKTGKPVDYDPAGGLQDYALPGPRRGRPEADAPKMCATWTGAPSGIWPASFDSEAGITYQTRTNGCTYQTVLRPTDEAFNPLQRENLGSSIRQVTVETVVNLIAVDVHSGEVVNTFTRDIGIPGDRQAEVGALATDGGLVFTGWDDGTIAALDKETLEVLWEFNLGTGMKGPIISYAVDGKQYIAHVAGGDNPGSSGIRSLIMPTAMLVVYGL